MTQKSTKQNFAFIAPKTNCLRFWLLYAFKKDRKSDLVSFSLFASRFLTLHLNNLPTILWCRHFRPLHFSSQKCFAFCYDRVNGGNNSIERLTEMFDSFFGPNLVAGPVFQIWTAKMHSRNNCCRWNFRALVNHFFLSFFSLRNFAVLKPRKETWQDIQMTWNFCSASEWHLSHSSPVAINARNYVI